MFRKLFKKRASKKAEPSLLRTILDILVQDGAAEKQVAEVVKVIVKIKTKGQIPWYLKLAKSKVRSKITNATLQQILSIIKPEALKSIAKKINDDNGLFKIIDSLINDLSQGSEEKSINLMGSDISRLVESQGRFTEASQGSEHSLSPDDQGYVEAFAEGNYAPLITELTKDTDLSNFITTIVALTEYAAESHFAPVITDLRGKANLTNYLNGNIEVLNAKLVRLFASFKIDSEQAKPESDQEKKYASELEMPKNAKVSKLCETAYSSLDKFIAKIESEPAFKELLKNLNNGVFSEEKSEDPDLSAPVADLSKGYVRPIVAALSQKEGLGSWSEPMSHALNYLKNTTKLGIVLEGLSDKEYLISQLEIMLQSYLEDGGKLSDDKLRQCVNDFLSLLNEVTAKPVYSGETNEALISDHSVGSPYTKVTKQKAQEMNKDPKIPLDDIHKLQELYRISMRIRVAIEQGLNTFNNFRPFVEDCDAKVQHLLDFYANNQENAAVKALLDRVADVESKKSELSPVLETPLNVDFKLNKYKSLPEDIKIILNDCGSDKGRIEEIKKCLNDKKSQLEKAEIYAIEKLLYNLQVNLDDFERKKKIEDMKATDLIELTPKEVLKLPDQVLDILGIDRKVAEFKTLKSQDIEDIIDLDGQIRAMRSIEDGLKQIGDKGDLLGYLRQNQDLVEKMLKIRPSDDVSVPSMSEQDYIDALKPLFRYQRQNEEKLKADQSTVKIDYKYDLSSAANTKQIIKFFLNFSLSVSLIVFLVMQYQGIMSVMSLNIVLFSIIVAIVVGNLALKEPNDNNLDIYAERYVKRNLNINERKNFINSFRGILNKSHSKLKFEVEFIIKALDRKGFVSLHDVKNFASNVALNNSAALPLAQVWFAFRNIEYYSCACNSSMFSAFFKSGSIRALSSMSELQYVKQRLLINLNFENLGESVSSLVQVMEKLHQCNITDCQNAVAILENPESPYLDLEQYLKPFNVGKSDNQIGKFPENELAVTDLLKLKVRSKESEERIANARAEALALYKDSVLRLDYKVDDKKQAELAYFHQDLLYSVWPIIFTSVISVFGISAYFIFHNTLSMGFLVMGIVFAVLSIYLLINKLLGAKKIANMRGEFISRRNQAYEDGQALAKNTQRSPDQEQPGIAQVWGEPSAQAGISQQDQEQQPQDSQVDGSSIATPMPAAKLDDSNEVVAKVLADIVDEVAQTHAEEKHNTC